MQTTIILSLIGLVYLIWGLLLWAGIRLENKEKRERGE